MQPQKKPAKWELVEKSTGDVCESTTKCPEIGLEPLLVGRVRSREKQLKEKQRRVNLNCNLLASLTIGSSEREAAAYFCLLKLVQSFLLANSNLEPLNNGDYRCSLIKFVCFKFNASTAQQCGRIFALIFLNYIFNPSIVYASL